MRATRYVAVALAGAALTAAGCGGGGSKSSAGGGQTAAQSATGIVNGARAIPSGPAKLHLELSLKVAGSPKDPQIATFIGKPVTLTVDGATDTTASKSDVTFALAAGPLTFDGAVRQDGDKGWLQFQGQWYTLPARSGSSSSGGTGGTSVSPTNLSSVLGAFGRPSSLLRRPVLVGSEDVGGVKADHVRGDLDLAALLGGIGKASGSAQGQSGSASPVSAASLQRAVTELRRYVKKAVIDLWVGEQDHTLHKVAAVVDGALDAKTRQSSGVDGFTLNLTATQSSASTPDVTAPADPKPFSQLQADLGGLIGGGSIAGLGGTTTA